MDSHVSREAVIDAISDELDRIDHVPQWVYDRLINRIKILESAEEESFEWCTDCKEYDQEKHCCHRFSKIINQTVEEVRGTTAIGEWVKVHGFVTPGGDPVWQCSNCGKGIHVFGVEHHSYGADIADNQWVACPNCGAIMIGERDG